MQLFRSRAAAWLGLALTATATRPVVAQPSLAEPTLVVPPRPLAALHADYPNGAQREAYVVVLVVVDADGSVRGAHATVGDEPFASAAVAASSGWRFAPAKRDGKPVAATIKVAIRFVPPPAPPAAASSALFAGASPRAGPKALEVTVHGEQPAPGAQSFTRAEVRLLPGAFGDPFRAIDALPGVSPLVSGLPYFYVRGAPPGDVGYFLDGIRVPLLFHVGLGPSVVNPAIMDRVDLYSGGYPAGFGRYAGGVVSGTTRAPDPTWHSEAEVRIIDAGVMVQGPLPADAGSFFAAGRYAGTGALLSLVTRDVSLAYWDYQARATLHVTPRDDVTVFAFGAHDFLGTKNGAGVSQTVFDSTFHRVDVRFDHRLGGPEDHLSQAITLGSDLTSLDHGAFVADRVLSSRGEIVKRAAPSVLVRAGLDAEVDVYQADLLPFLPNDQNLALFPDHTSITAGAHADAVIDFTPRFELTPGIRIDLFGSRPQGGGMQSAVAVDPRLAARLVLAKEVRLVTANGLASQPPSFVLPGPEFDLGLGGGLQRSLQTSVGIEADLPWDVGATVTAFRNAFFNLSDTFGTSPVPTQFPPDTPFHLLSRSDGSSVGLEVALRRRLTRKLGGLVSYTLSRSERIVGSAVVPSSFDRTHVLNVAGSFDFGHGFKAGTRMLFYTGFPIDNLSPTDHGRVPPFFRLDVRAEKRWSIVSGRGFLSLVLEAENALGAKETIEETPVTGGYTPTRIGPLTLPSLGLEGSF